MKHYPVMFANVLKNISELYLSSKFKVADCNFGLGGHSERILENFPQASISAYELDSEMVAAYEVRENFSNRLNLINRNFTTIGEDSEGNVKEKFDVVLADLGFNSVQLEEKDGFSWNKNSPLDMRYSPSFRTCSEILNNASMLQILNILKSFGDLRGLEAENTAKKIIESRPINTTFQLRDNIVGCFQQQKTKKIAQVFQAFRIVTNNQLNDLRTLCEKMKKVLEKNGLCMIITFHSLERDIIHSILRQTSGEFSKIKTEKPSKKQISENPKSHSAQMLCFRKLC